MIYGISEPLTKILIKSVKKYCVFKYISISDYWILKMNQFFSFAGDLK